MAFQFVRYAAEGNLRKLKKCLDQGIHINAANIKKETALFSSSKNGKLKCSEFLLANGADPNRSTLYGMTAIHAAIQNVHIKCVGILLQYGSDLHCSFAEFPTVLSFARYHGNYDVLRLLHAFMEGKGLGHHQPAQNYNAVIMTTCASSSRIQLSESSEDKLVEGIPIIEADVLKKPDHNNSFNGPFFVYVDGMWRGSLVTVKHAPEFSEDEFYYFRLRKEITLLRQLRHFRFPVAMAICLDPFCVIMERFYYSSLSHYLRDKNMEMEKDTEFHLTRIARVMLDVAQALSHLHKKQWVHCHVTSQSIFVCDGPRAKLGSLEFCERPGEHIEFIDCFKEELPWLPPETLADELALCASDIYSFAATFWECLTRQVPWSWLKDSKIPDSRQLPVVLAWPSSLRTFLSPCFEEASHRPTSDDVCRILGQFMRLDISLERCQLDEIFKDWSVENASREYRLAKNRRTSMSSRSDLLSVALGEKYSSLVASSADNNDYGDFHEARAKCRFRRRSAVVTTLVEEALTTLVHIGLPPTEIHEHDIYKFGFKLARDIAELRGLCSVAKRTPRKTWAKVTMATRDLEEDMFDSLAGYEEVTFRRKHAHAANLKKRHQERTEEKLKDTLVRTRSLIRRHKRKNWACYTILLCDLYGILRRTDTIPDDEIEDFETEAINQSILHLGSQMIKISSVVIHSVAEDNMSGKFSPQWPMTDLSQLSDDLSCTSEQSTNNDETKIISKRESCYLESKV